MSDVSDGLYFRQMLFDCVNPRPIDNGIGWLIPTLISSCSFTLTYMYMLI